MREDIKRRNERGKKKKRKDEGGSGEESEERKRKGKLISSEGMSSEQEKETQVNKRQISKVKEKEKKREKEKELRNFTSKAKERCKREKRCPNGEGSHTHLPTEKAASTHTLSTTKQKDKRETHPRSCGDQGQSWG